MIQMAAVRRMVLRRTGGLSGMRLEATVDLSSEPPGNGGLAELLRGADVTELARRAAEGPQVPDGYRYALTVADDGGCEELSFPDTAIPPKLAPIIRFLERRALDERRGRRPLGGCG